MSASPTPYGRNPHQNQEEDDSEDDSSDSDTECNDDESDDDSAAMYSGSCASIKVKTGRFDAEIV